MQAKILLLLIFILTQCKHAPLEEVTVDQIISEVSIKRQFTAIKQKLLEALILNKKEISEILYIIYFDRVMLAYSIGNMTKSLMDQFNDFFSEKEKRELFEWNQHPLALRLEVLEGKLKKANAQKDIETFVNNFSYADYFDKNKKTERKNLELEINQLTLSAHIMVAMRVYATILIFVAKKSSSILYRLSVQEEQDVIDFINKEESLKISNWEKKLLPITIYNHKDLTDKELSSYIKILKLSAFRKKENLEVQQCLNLVKLALISILKENIQQNGPISNYLLHSFDF